MNQEILNTQHNHDSRVNCPPTDFRVFPFWSVTKQRPSSGAFLTGCQFVQYIFNCDV